MGHKGKLSLVNKKEDRKQVVDQILYHESEYILSYLTEHIESDVENQLCMVQVSTLRN